MPIDITVAAERKLTLSYLFYTFLKIGVVSFGGHMALIAVVQKEMVDRDKVIDNDVILNAVSIASLLPGPLAVNVITYIGYYLKGKMGAVISMVAVLLPACLLMLILSYFYFTNTYQIQAEKVMYFVMGTVGAVILSTSFSLFKKEVIGNLKKIAICLVAIVIQLLFKSYLITTALLVFGGIAGLLFQVEQISTNHSKFSFIVPLKTKLVLATLAIVELLYISNIAKVTENVFLKIVIIFSGISLSLFGGGYVMIPIMQSLFVNDLIWLSQQEFIDAIAFSQITPGPILVSATFIGYKVGGLIGALLATTAIFIPSGVLMLFISGLWKKNKDNSRLRHIMGGIKGVVIGLIIASGIEILMKLDKEFVLMGITIICFILNFKYKISPVYLILSSIFAGVILKIYL